MQFALKKLLRTLEKEKVEIEWELKEIEWRLDQEASVSRGTNMLNTVAVYNVLGTLP